MKALVVEWNEYDLKPVDIDSITEEECQLLMDEQLMSIVNYGRWKRNQCSFAVLTFYGPALPIGTAFSFGKGDPDWRVFAKNKAFYLIRFSSRQFDELQYDYHAFDYEFKPLLQAWARKRGIRFDE